MKNFKLTRRDALKVLTTSSLLVPLNKALSSNLTENLYTKESSIKNVSTLSYKNKKYKKKFIPRISDGPFSLRFNPIFIEGNKTLPELNMPVISEKMLQALKHAPTGQCTAWGIPFDISKKIIFLKETPVHINLNSFNTNWLIFLHTADTVEMEKDKFGLYATPFKGAGQLGVNIAEYTVIYDDGTKEHIPIKLRHQIGMFQRGWGENCTESVAHHKPIPKRANHEQETRNWGGSQTRVNTMDRGKWTYWLWAWENPHPKKSIAGFQFEPKSGIIILSAISAGNVSSNPLRWVSRRKAILSLPNNVDFDPSLDEDGLLSQIQLDMGQIISATPRMLYPNKEWAQTYNNKLPETSSKEIIIEYTAHVDAQFHLFDGTTVPVSFLAKESKPDQLKPIAPALQTVKIRVVDKDSHTPVAVKLHVHGEAGEYLAPIDRHRIPNPAWFEDYSVDFTHRGIHHCTYISGETMIKLPIGKVYIEVSKGFEIKPVRKFVEISLETKQITIQIEKVLPWREKGWVTADTHVHFLSPGSALLEGAGEGINVVNLLASQWGELMTNVGDFDGKTTYGAQEAGGDGEYLVRVGTENRQHVLGHISLLGYNGNMITPMTTGGPDESALGDPIEVLLTEWARQCKKQNGVVILPHFPNPRLEHAASIVSGEIDGVEMTSWGNLYSGISPYSLVDWYRYLNCGYFVAAVGGTDKMSASTAVGTVRTYAKIENEDEFDYDVWKQAIRKGHTFVTYGPLLEFAVDGKASGTWIKMSSFGGTVDVTWKVASVTVPMSKVELVINGEIKEGRSVHKWEDNGHWSVKIDKCSWLALLVRGHYEDQPEIIAAHSSPVMVQVSGSEFFAAADAVTILEQIEGALAYLDTIGTRTDDIAYKRMRLVLESSHRSLHNRMHQFGMYHNHTPKTYHHEHG